ncbi:BRO family protein [Streptosporangium sp. NBC_01755]|uniref:BRO family protein n=1 Tax=Streptosporangium sp. NBC_01755 TaxID=2975949 RepID=UPI002DDBB775|nr:BRO family protein [Streptosporangium sp. NBC_01755]WSD03771.1 BRO family protein [Streptosporangium sp. NBC_01755]
MSEIELFRFPVTGQDIRSILINGEPWFVGKDAATILAYVNTRKAIKDHVPARHRGGNETFPLADLGLDPQTVLISEPGLYRLIMRSKTAVADQFQEWVTADVLPSLRKTGQYTIEAAKQAAIPEDYAAALRRIADEVEARALAEKQRDALLPLAEAYADLMEADGTFDWAAVAQIFSRITGGLGRNNFLDLLRSDEVKVLKDNNTPYQLKELDRYFKVIPRKASKTDPTTRVTPEGLDWLRKRLIKHFNHQPTLFAIGEIAS